MKRQAATSSSLVLLRPSGGADQARSKPAWVCLPLSRVMPGAMPFTRMAEWARACASSRVAPAWASFAMV